MPGRKFDFLTGATHHVAGRWSCQGQFRRNRLENAGPAAGRVTMSRASRLPKVFAAFGVLCAATFLAPAAGADPAAGTRHHQRPDRQGLQRPDQLGQRGQQRAPHPLPGNGGSQSRSVSRHRPIEYHCLRGCVVPQRSRRRRLGRYRDRVRLTPTAVCTDQNAAPLGAEVVA